MSAIKSMSKKVIDKNLTKLSDELINYCSTDNLITCFVTLAIVAYIMILNPSTVLDFFGTSIGKLISMIVLVCVLCIDVKVGILVGFAVVLSIGFAHIHKTDEIVLESMYDNIHESFKIDTSESDVVDDEMMDEVTESQVPPEPKAEIIEEEDDDEEFSNYSKF